MPTTEFFGILTHFSAKFTILLHLIKRQREDREAEVYSPFAETRPNEREAEAMLKLYNLRHAGEIPPSFFSVSVSVRGER